MSKRRLGKGIDALLQGRDLEQLTTMSTILMVDMDKLEANPDQPRTRFNDDTLAELADSIREKGLIQPILAEDRGDGTYVIVAGERRYRAAKIAGMDQVPIIPQDFTPEEKLEIALVENLQREDLNPIDEALAFSAAMKNAGLTQDQLAKRLGKGRVAIANAVRLLKLEPEIRQAVSAGVISAGHARALLAKKAGAERLELFGRVVDEELSVRETETAGRPTDTKSPADTPTIGDDEFEDVPPGPSKPPKPSTPALSPELQKLEDKLIEALGTRVVVRGANDKGSLTIPYYSPDDLDRLLEILGVSLD